MKSSLRILHLEDDASDAEIIRALLRRQGIECSINRVHSRQSFLAALERCDCDLILSDYSMPGFDGLGALALAREKCPDVPFIFLSGTLGEEAAVESLKHGAADYLLKDRPSRLGAAIRRAMAEVEEHHALRRAEESMTESESKYRQLFECLADAAILADAETGRVLDANKQAETLLDRNRGELIGVNEKQILSPVTSAEFHQGLAGTNGQNSRVTVFGEVVAKTGRVIPVTVSASPLVLYGHRLVLEIFREHPEMKSA